MSKDLPSGWSWAELRDVCLNQDGRRVPVEAKERAKRSGPYPYYGASGIIDSIDDFLFEGPHLLVAEDGANLLSRKTPIAFSADGKFWVNNHAHVLAESPKMPLAFLERYLNSIDLRFIVTGSAQPKLTQKALNAIPVPVPPLDEQRRIVARIEELTARSKTAKQALQAIPPLLEKFRQSVLAAAFRGDLSGEWRGQNPAAESAEALLSRITVEKKLAWEAAGGKGRSVAPSRVDESQLPKLPKGWAWAGLQELMMEPYQNGKSVQGTDSPLGTPVLRLNAITGGKIDYQQIKYVSLPTALVSKLAIVEGDFFVSRANGSLRLCGTGALADLTPTTPTIYPDLLIRLRIFKQLISWVSSIWSAPFMRLQLEQRAKTTAGIWKISQGDLDGIRIPIPPQDEAKFAAELLQHYLGWADSVEMSVSLSDRRLHGLNESILARAFRGELTAQGCE